MQDVRSCIVASLTRYRGKDAVIKASPPLYSGEDATTVESNTTSLVLNSCIKDFDVAYLTLKSRTKEGILGSRRSKKWGRGEKIEQENKIMYTQRRA